MKSLTELAAKIVTAQASHATLSPEEISEALKQTFNALGQISAAEGSGDDLAQAEDKSDPVSDALTKLQANPKRSIKQKCVICLECGEIFKMMTKTHLKAHDLTPKEYRKKWGFKSKESLASKELSAKRKANAEKHDLGANLVKKRGKRGRK